MSEASDVKAAAAEKKMRELGNTPTGRNSSYATLRFLGYRYHVINQSWDTKQPSLPGLGPESKS